VILDITSRERRERRNKGADEEVIRQIKKAADGEDIREDKRMIRGVERR
jgi:hypothetical protein